MSLFTDFDTVANRKKILRFIAMSHGFSRINTDESGALAWIFQCASEVCIGVAFMGDAVVFCREHLITKPMGNIGSARGGIFFRLYCHPARGQTASESLPPKQGLTIIRHALFRSKK